MKPIFAVKVAILSISFSLLLVGCGDGDEMSQEEIQYLSHVDQSRFFQRQGELKASTLEARSAIEMQPNRVEPYLVIIKNLLTAGDARNAERQLDKLMESIDKDSISQQSLNDAALTRAKANFMQREFDDALSALQSIKNADRVQQLEATLLRGHVQLSSGNEEAARQTYEEARELDASSVEPLIGLSKVAFSEGNAAKVNEYIAAANDVDPENEELWLWKARVAHADQRWSDAEQSYIRALETIGQYDVMTFKKFETMSALIDVLRQQGKSSEAFVYEEILAKSAPGTIRSNLIAAQEAYSKGDLHNAARYLEETLAQAPSHEQASLMLGIIRYQQGRPKEAEALLAPVAELEDSEQAQKLLAATRLQMRNPIGAKEVLEGLENQDSDPETLALVGIASIVSGDAENGLKLVEKSLELKPDNTTLRLRYTTYLLQQGQYGDAVDQARKILEYDSSSERARLLILEAHIKDGDLEAARAASDEWLKSFPNNMNAIIAKGNLEFREGNPDRAKKAFETARAAAPENPEPLIALANLALSQGDQEAATALFKNAIELNPDNQQALRGLSRVMNRADMTAYMEQIFENNPDSIGPRLVMLESALLKGDSAKADELTATLLEREDADAPAPSENLVATIYHGIASQLAQSDRTADAQEVLKRGRALFPENEQIALQAAILQFATGETKTAREILAEVKQTHPNSASPFFVEARYFEQNEEFDQAADLYQIALAKTESSELEVSYARSLSKSGQPAKAQESLEDARNRFPESLPVLLNLAILQQQNGDVDGSSETYADLLDIAPDNVIALNNLAWIYHEKGDDSAIELAKRAYELNPENAAIADTFGWIMFKSGQTEASLPVLEKAHKLKPDSEEIAMHLADAYIATGKESEAKRILEKFKSDS